MMADLDVDLMVEEDERLRELRDSLIDAAREGRCENNEKNGPVGYYVEMMLVEPHVRTDEAVVAPPPELDRSNPMNQKKVPPGAPTRMGEEEEEMDGCPNDDDVNDDDNGRRPGRRKSVLRRDVHASRRFAGPTGPWEKACTKAFCNIGLDVRKALARVEFPTFPEGCRERTFREVYQLNARVSYIGRAGRM